MSLWEELLLPAVVLAVIMGSIISIGSWVQSYQCNEYAMVTGKPTKYVGLQCYVKEADGWYLIEGVVSK